MEYEIKQNLFVEATTTIEAETEEEALRKIDEMDDNEFLIKSDLEFVEREGDAEIVE